MYNLPTFDQLKELHDYSPEAFEALRSELVNECIESAPEYRRNRLQGLQFHIDSRRSLAKNPLESCITLSKMMHEEFWGLHDSLEVLSELRTAPKRVTLQSVDQQQSKLLAPDSQPNSEEKTADILHLDNNS